MLIMPVRSLPTGALVPLHHCPLALNFTFALLHSFNTNICITHLKEQYIIDAKVLVYAHKKTRTSEK